MSAFIVDYKVIDNILASRFNATLLYKVFFFKNEFDNIIGSKGDCYIIDELTKIGKEFLKLNTDSVNFRYDEPATEEDLNYINEYEFNDCGSSIVQSIKSVQCLMYQSCEVDNYKDNETYKKLEILLDLLKESYLYLDEDYQNAKWGDCYEQQTV